MTRQEAQNNHKKWLELWNDLLQRRSKESSEDKKSEQKQSTQLDLNFGESK